MPRRRSTRFHWISRFEGATVSSRTEWWKNDVNWTHRTFDAIRHGTGIFSSRPLSDRKLTLCFCACVHSLPTVYTCSDLFKAVSVAEAYADGVASESARLAASRGAIFDDDATSKLAMFCLSNQPWQSIYHFSRTDKYLEIDFNDLIGFIKESYGDPFDPVVRGQLTACETCWGHASFDAGCEHVTFSFTPQIMSLAQAAYDLRIPAVCRCLVCEGRQVYDGETCSWCKGNGYTPAIGNKGPIAGQLDPQRLMVLADALEENQIDAPSLLAALRVNIPRYRGFWAVDLVLNKR